jgi:AbiJ N-terminal domain 4
MRFSQRKGHRPVAEVLQVNGMSAEMRSSLWNALDQFLWSSRDFVHTEFGRPGIWDFSHAMWFHFLKRAADERPTYGTAILGQIRELFFGWEWYEVYDFIEWFLGYFEGDKRKQFQDIFNILLESELAGYRIIDGKVADITDAQEIEMLEQALADTTNTGAAAHLKRSLELLADRKAPDYRNSIKESISAVESIARTISNSPKATLGEALKILEKKDKIHPALKEGFLRLYGYTSDKDGIRHAMLLDEPNLTQADARYMLMSCTSFINYLKAQL